MSIFPFSVAVVVCFLFVCCAVSLQIWKSIAFVEIEMKHFFFFLVVDTRRRNDYNGQASICKFVAHSDVNESLRSTADQLTETFRSNSAMPL